MLLRFFLYGLIGWCAEVVWTAVYDTIAGYRPDPDDPMRRVPIGRAERLRLVGHTYLWMLPIYGSAAVLFEPVHDALRTWAWPLRGLVYMVGCFVVEYVAGAIIRRITGRCPWDYSYSRWSVHGYIRLDYAPVWFLFGMGLERIHDLLVIVERCVRAG